MRPVFETVGPAVRPPPFACTVPENAYVWSTLPVTVYTHSKLVLAPPASAGTDGGVGPLA
ncbi:MAG: hypothetical protein HYU51_16325 [Candidatus Rokubacteria bacterium]|nr:hypothetical protein [Candidatus Rokubacteria bacterium]